MILDMHCHTKEGSLDAKVDIISYVHQLILLGYDGMVVTDHNSYKGYETWQKYLKHHKFTPSFRVLKGIEYDTVDAGHFLVIMPDHIHLKLLEIRGMPIKKLLILVHEYGGIVGPAHPYGYGSISFTNTSMNRHSREIFAQCDFMETFNGCETPLSNLRAEILAKKYKKIAISGSDAHRISAIGSAYTKFDCDIRCNNDLIHAIKTQKQPEIPSLPAHTVLRHCAHKERNLLMRFLIDSGFFVYNQAVSLYNMPRLSRELHKLL